MCRVAVYANVDWIDEDGKYTYVLSKIKGKENNGVGQKYIEKEIKIYKGENNIFVWSLYDYLFVAVIVLTWCCVYILCNFAYSKYI